LDRAARVNARPRPLAAWYRAGEDGLLASAYSSTWITRCCRIGCELDRRRSPAERAAISEDQAQALKGVIHAVLDGIGLSGEQRERAIEIAVVELRRAAGEEP